MYTCYSSFLSSICFVDFIRPRWEKRVPNFLSVISLPNGLHEGTFVESKFVGGDGFVVLKFFEIILKTKTYFSHEPSHINECQTTKCSRSCKAIWPFCKTDAQSKLSFRQEYNRQVVLTIWDGMKQSLLNHRLNINILDKIVRCAGIAASDSLVVEVGPG